MSVTALLQQAIPLHQQGKLQAASALYMQVLDIAPQQFDALHLLGVIARQSGNHALAIELISEALQSDGNQAQAHCNLGAALQDAGRSTEALASYERAIALQPAYDIAHCNRANTLRKLNRLDEALTGYDQALALRPSYPEACCNRALVLLDLGQAPEALSSARQALNARPAYPEALRACGTALLSMGRYHEALASYDSAIRLKGNDAELLCCRGLAQHKLQQPEAALNDYERALALRPDYATAHQHRANTLALLGRKDDAIAAYRRALALGGDGGQIGFALAALGAEPAPASAPEAYVKGLFDQYAGHFDQHLVDKLGYRTPALIDAALARAGLAGRGDALDLGCGTGLCGPCLRPFARSLTGVDLSGNMLRKARGRGLYDRLECMDIGQFLACQEQAYDLVVAADVFVYIGELAKLFTQVHRALRSGGLFAFSVESCAGESYTLRSSSRYAHSLGYLNGLVAASAWRQLDLQELQLRMDKDAAVNGYLLVLQKP